VSPPGLQERCAVLAASTDLVATMRRFAEQIG
jgi:hypothetical protein